MMYPCALLGACLLATCGYAEVPLPAGAAHQEPPAASSTGDRVSELLAEGRAALEGGQVERARELFVEAHVLDEESFRTRVWILRTWLSDGRINDVFAVVDTWLDEGREDPELAWLIGHAFHRRAKEHAANGVPHRTVVRAFEDASEYLAAAVAAKPALFTDAWLPLAEAAWFSGDHALARTAATREIERAPTNPAPRYLLARSLFGLYVEARRALPAPDTGEPGGESTDPARAPEPAPEQVASLQAAADQLWLATEAALLETAQVAGEPADESGERLRAQVAEQLAYLELWREQPERSATYLAEAITWSPGALDPGGWVELLDTTHYLRALESGRTGAIGRRPQAASAVLEWWYGYAHFAEAVESEEALRALPGGAEQLATHWHTAEGAFRRALALDMELVNAWYYIGRCRYHLDDYEGYLASFKRLFEIEPTNLIGMLDTEREHNLRVLSWVIGWCNDLQRLSDATFLCELRVGLEPLEWEPWNDLGFFARDAGEARLAAGGEGAELEAEALWQRSVSAYEEACRLSPDRPHLINDHAVVLQYYLKRDWERAREMYEEARAMARRVLAGEELSAADRELAEQALQNATRNLAELDRR